MTGPSRANNTLEGYQKNGGYEQLKKALTMQPAAITDEVKKSGLRGRGGAGFPTGLKWSFVPSLEKNTKPRYLAINADESEPGTAKDRFILENDPHLLLEGIGIACFALGAHTCYIYARGEFKYPSAVLDKAIAEAYAAGIFGKKLMGTDFELNVYQVRGAGAYICGEETALLESLEGKKGWPRLKPPFPAVVGLFGCPTVVNNVETIASLPRIFEKGADWFMKLGTGQVGRHPPGHPVRRGDPPGHLRSGDEHLAARAHLRAGVRPGHARGPHGEGRRSGRELGAGADRRRDST